MAKSTSIVNAKSSKPLDCVLDALERSNEDSITDNTMPGTSLNNGEKSRPTLQLYVDQNSDPASMMNEDSNLETSQVFESDAPTFEPTNQLAQYLSSVAPDNIGSSNFQTGGPQISAFQTLDGQLVYVTYTVRSGANESRPLVLAVAEGENVSPECMGVSLSEVCAEGNSAAMTLESIAKELLLQHDVEEDTRTSATRDLRRKRIGPIGLIGTEIGIEQKLNVRDAMLTPLPAKKERKKQVEKKALGRYDCDLCSASFKRATQLYGHMHTHSGDRGFPCNLCPPGKAIFSRASNLVHHERRCHKSVRMHTCRACDATFDRLSQLHYHTRRIHLLEKQHSCQICSKGFFKRSDLKNHLNAHLGISTHTCPTCGRRFSHVSNLTRHVRTHTGVKPYVCSECGHRFSQPSAMLAHKVSCHSSQRVPCLMCSRTFKSLIIMRKHVRFSHPTSVDSNHNSEVLQMKTGPQNKRFHCCVCGESFRFAARLHAHELSHGTGDFRCSSCLQLMPSLEQLKSHSCGLSDDVPQERVKHKRMKELHTQVEADNTLGEIVIYVSQEGQAQPTQVVIKPLANDINDSMVLLDQHEQSSAGEFLSQTAEETMMDDTEVTSKENLSAIIYNTHQQSDTFILPDLDGGDFGGAEGTSEGSSPSSTRFLVTPSQMNSAAGHSQPSVQPRKQSQKVYHCLECGKQFSKNTNYKQHMGIHFVDQQRHVCSVCDRAFAWRSTLNKHMATHSTDKPMRYGCSQCSRHYSTQFQVQEHVKRDHNKERTHVCSVCDKAFYKRNDLKLHTRIHTQEKPYMCGTCGKCFYHPSHIIRHERTHTGHRPYSCHCGRAFTQSNSLRTHSLSHQRCSAVPVVA